MLYAQSDYREQMMRQGRDQREGKLTAYRHEIPMRPVAITIQTAAGRLVQPGNQNPMKEPHDERSQVHKQQKCQTVKTN